jgi:hypothetical protein
VTCFSHTVSAGPCRVNIEIQLNFLQYFSHIAANLLLLLLSRSPVIQSHLFNNFNIFAAEGQKKALLIHLYQRVM